MSRRAPYDALRSQLFLDQSNANPLPKEQPFRESENEIVEEVLYEQLRNKQKRIQELEQKNSCENEHNTITTLQQQVSNLTEWANYYNSNDYKKQIIQNLLYSNCLK